MSANKNPNREIIFSFPFREMREAVELGKRLQNTAKENEKKAALLAKRRDNWRARALAAEAELGRLQTKRAALEESHRDLSVRLKEEKEVAKLFRDLRASTTRAEFSHSIESRSFAEFSILLELRFSEFDRWNRIREYFERHTPYTILAV